MLIMQHQGLLKQQVQFAGKKSPNRQAIEKELTDLLQKQGVRAPAVNFIQQPTPPMPGFKGKPQFEIWINVPNQKELQQVEAALKQAGLKKQKKTGRYHFKTYPIQLDIVTLHG